jgi:hypothetical protein
MTDSADRAGMPRCTLAAQPSAWQLNATRGCDGEALEGHPYGYAARLRRRLSALGATRTRCVGLRSTLAQSPAR